jgi:raffinose/stachyose/melibiose transport system substrate-binding protein
MVSLRRASRAGSAWLVGIAALAFTVAGCGPGGGGSSAKSSPATSAQSTPAPLPKGPVTLKLLDYQSSNNAQLGKGIDELIKEFEAQHPNVTIQREHTSFSDLLTKQQLIMNGPNPPDIVDIAVNYTVESKFARSGTILDLANYAKQYGWASRFSPFLYGQSRFSSSGKLEQGDPYGIFFTEDVVGVYYNRQKLAALGLGVPKTFDEFEADLAKIKAAGQQPLAFGNLDKYPAIHAFQQVQNRYAKKDYLRDYSYRLNQPMTFNEPWNVQSAQKFQQWVKAGYFGTGLNGLGIEDAKAQFIKGKGVFFISGTWEAKSIDDGMHSNAGFFVMPPPADNSTPLTVLGGLGQTFTIHGKSKHPEWAAAFLDFLISQRAAQVYLNDGSVPGFKFTPPANVTPLRKDVLAAIQTANDKDALVGYLDGPTPRMYDVLSASLQDLIAGKATPTQFVNTVQSDYAKGP